MRLKAADIFEWHDWFAIREGDVQQITRITSITIELIIKLITIIITQLSRSNSQHHRHKQQRTQRIIHTRINWTDSAGLFGVIPLFLLRGSHG